jgi:hypothetical protein
MVWDIMNTTDITGTMNMGTWDIIRGDDGRYASKRSSNTADLIVEVLDLLLNVN